MNSSLKDEVIYLILRCEHEDLWTTHIRSNCTRMMESTNSAAFPRNHRRVDRNYFVIIIVPVFLSLENFHFFKTNSLRMFSGTTICDNQNSLLMGPQRSEIRAQCTSGFGTWNNKRNEIRLRSHCDCFRMHSPFKCCMTHTSGKSPSVGTTFASPVHFILQPLKQHSKQIYRRLKTKKNKGRKQKT